MQYGRTIGLLLWTASACATNEAQGPNTPSPTAVSTGAAEFAADAQTSEPEPEEPTPEAEPDDQTLAAPQSTTMSQLWEHPAQLTQAPVALPNGVLLCSQEDTGAQLRRLDVQGKEQWSAALAESCSTPLLVSADRVFVGVGDSIQALHLRSGEPLWTTPVPKLARESAHSTHGPGLSLLDPHPIVGVQRELMGLDLHSGQVQWTTSVGSHGSDYVFEHPEGLARIRAGASSPPRFGSSSRWGYGSGYWVHPEERSAQWWSADDLEAATGLSQLDHFVSAPRWVEQNHYLLMQRTHPSPPVRIRHVTSPDGTRQAIGGKRARPQPAGIALLRLSAEGWTGVDVTTAESHVMLAVGDQNHPAQNLLHSGSTLLFSTASKQGDAVTLQAWSTDLQPQWQRANQILLAVSGEKILTGWDADPFRYDVRVRPAGELRLSALNTRGEDLGSIPLPWSVLAMPYLPSCLGHYCYLSSPEGSLLSVQLP